MSQAFVEHINVTVHDPDKAAQLMCELFDWHIRWSGDAIHGGRSVHVGSDTSYIAFFSQDGVRKSPESSYLALAGLNHIGIVVDDLDAAEARIVSRGYETKNHANYDPGRRFYFDTDDGIEVEVVSYL